MGENKIVNDQQLGMTNTDQQQIYGSHLSGRHNLAENSSTMLDKNNEEGSNTQQYITNQQFLDIQKEELVSDSYTLDDENYQYSLTDLLNEKVRMASNVEGDYEDILGETENAQRNEHRIKAKETDPGNPQNR